MTTFHYYLANSLCYAKGATIEEAQSRLEVKVFPNQPEKEMPLSIIKVLEPMDKSYSINSFLPEGVHMIVEQQDYESNLPLNEDVFFEDGTLFFGQE